MGIPIGGRRLLNSASEYCEIWPLIIVEDDAKTDEAGVDRRRAQQGPETTVGGPRSVGEGLVHVRPRLVQSKVGELPRILVDDLYRSRRGTLAENPAVDHETVMI